MSIGVLLVIVCSVCAEDKVVETGLTFYTGGKSKPVPWSQIVKLVNDKLDDAQQVNIFVDSCYDGALIDAAKDADNGLNMPFVIGTSNTALKKSTDGTSNGKDKKPPGRMKAGDNLYYFSYKAYLTKKMQAGTSTIKQLHDAAAADVTADKGLKQTSQYFKSDNANDGLNIDAGTKSKHALVFAANMDDLWARPPRAQHKAVRGLGFNSVEFYYHNYIEQNLPEGGKISGTGSFDNFKKAIMDLETAVDANKKEETVSIFLNGHGYRETKNVKKKAAAIPEQPKQGTRVQGSELSSLDLDIDMDSEFWADLKEDVLVDTPSLVRSREASFFLAASELDLSQPMTVSIGRTDEAYFDVGTFSSGDFLTQPGSDSAYLDVSLEPELLSSLVAAYDGLSDLSLHFEMEAEDSFILGIGDDLFHDSTYLLDTYGVGLSTSVSLVVQVPEPSSFALVMCVWVLIGRRLRRRRRA